MTSTLDAANYTGLRLVIREQSEPAMYEFQLQNQGGLVLWGIELSTYDVLGPGQFGLDDTHMPRSMTHEPQWVIPRLGPGESAVLLRKKWGRLAAYLGPAEGDVYVTFSTREDAGDLYGARPKYTVFGSDGSVVAVRAREPHRSRAYDLGRRFSRWLRRWSSG